MSATAEKVCNVCAFAEEHGYTPDDLAHCDGCHRSWKGHAVAHCSECHATFTSDTGFDLHLKGDGCKDPATARRKNGFALYRLVERFGGPTWALAPVLVSNHFATQDGA